MGQNKKQKTILVDWLTTIAIASVAISLTQIVHEGTHALSCLVLGAELKEFSALHILCAVSSIWQSKIVSGSAVIANVILGVLIFMRLRKSRKSSYEIQFFLWLLMLMNLLLATGYWIFSGIADVGDWANVISGLEPAWFWRTLMTIVGMGTYLFAVRLALHELGQMIGGNDPDEQIRRAAKLGLLSYISVFLVILIAAIFNPYGITGLPAIAGLLLALGGMFPLLWMMQWFRAKSFVKVEKAPLAIQRHPFWLSFAILAVIIYSIFLGRAFYF